MPEFLGIDTSNYTTSAALFLSETNSVKSFGQLLPVKSGEKGLRQSDAVFLHTKALPEIIPEALKTSSGISAVGVSVSPRDNEGSYMPCFLSGVAVAKALSAGLRISMHSFSHQRGHIAAALYSAERYDLFSKKFIAFHISGGTTEAVLVTPDEELILSCELIAETLDLNAGQLIDRVGVMLGLNFPAGQALEKAALTVDFNEKIKVTLKNCNCCLSGIENKCKKMLESGSSAAEISRYTLEFIGETVLEMCKKLILIYGELPIVFAGGVMSNSIIREKLSGRFDCIFAKPEFSRDNAAGIALLTAIKEGALL